MKRAPSIVLVILPGAVFLAVAADWARSVNNSETFILSRAKSVWAIDNFDGEIAFWRGTPLADLPAIKQHWWHEHWEPPYAYKTASFNVVSARESEWALAGFMITMQRRFPTTGKSILPSQLGPRVGVVIPLWFPALIFGAWTYVAARRYVRATRREQEGLCRVCGYDLRATRDRCPECGTPIVATGAT